MQIVNANGTKMNVMISTMTTMVAATAVAATAVAATMAAVQVPKISTMMEPLTMSMKMMTMMA